jgi:cyanate permease
MLADRYSGPHYGAIVGVGLMGSAAGSAVGPWLAGALFDALGSYTVALLVAAACGVVAGWAGWRARKLRLQPLRSTSA